MNRLAKATLSTNFVEAWVYTAALSVVEQCQLWAKEAGLDYLDVPGFVARSGELLELAIRQVRKFPPQLPPMARSWHGCSFFLG
jgi:trafficking protein particle complex subunit 10